MSRSDSKAFAILVGIGFVVLSGLLIGACYAYPKYKVWEQRLAGEAELAKAEQNRQVVIQEAHAKKEAATMLADAEVERAKGVAQANKIIGDSLKGHDEYLKWLWIDKLSEGSQRETIYIPTESNFPMMEAGRLNKAEPVVEGK